MTQHEATPALGCLNEGLLPLLLPSPQLIQAITPLQQHLFVAPKLSNRRFPVLKH